jgi:hypothetical protein
MKRILGAAAALLVALGAAATAQNRDAEPRVLKQLMDNERVRVFQANFKPGDKLGPRNFPNHLMYMLTDGTLVFTPAGRTGYEVSFKAGEAMWFPPLERLTENDSDKEVRVLLVELKDGGGTRAVASKAKSRAKGKAKAKAKPAAKPMPKPKAGAKT